MPNIFPSLPIEHSSPRTRSRFPLLRVWTLRVHRWADYRRNEKQNNFDERWYSFFRAKKLFPIPLNTNRYFKTERRIFLLRNRNTFDTFEGSLNIRGENNNRIAPWGIINTLVDTLRSYDDHHVTSATATSRAPYPFLLTVCINFYFNLRSQHIDEFVNRFADRIVRQTTRRSPEWPPS